MNIFILLKFIILIFFYLFIYEWKNNKALYDFDQEQILNLIQNCKTAVITRC